MNISLSIVGRSFIFPVLLLAGCVFAPVEPSEEAVLSSLSLSSSSVAVSSLPESWKIYDNLG
ncbi:MAG TPA: hypothetical protein VI913_02045 [Candidatus Peribacteraceae bacterium]|nr:hypothetical protein [Candidatus Peribacteraceae bacterium]